jgi:hypothetical protein
MGGNCKFLRRIPNDRGLRDYLQRPCAILVSTAVVYTSSVLAAPPTGPAQSVTAELSYQGFLRIQICITNGYFAVDNTSSNTWYSNTIPSKATIPKSDEEIKAALVATVNDGLKTLGPAFIWALPDAYRVVYPGGPVTNVDTKPVARYTGSWISATTDFYNWETENKLPIQTNWLTSKLYLQTVLTGARPNYKLNPSFGTNFTASPLNFRNTANIKFVEKVGWLDFDVQFFTQNDLSPSNIILSQDSGMFVYAGITSEELARRVAGLQGSLWSGDKLHRQLDDEFTRMGYLVSDGNGTTTPGAVVIQPLKNLNPGQNGAGVKIYGAPRLDSIIILEPRTNQLGMLLPLYEILSSSDFKKVKAAIVDPSNRDVTVYPTNKTQYIYDVSEITLTNAAWKSLAISSKYFNQTTFNDQLRNLGTPGYQAVLYSDPDAKGERWAYLVLIPPSGVPLRTGQVSNSTPTVVQAASRTNMVEAAKAPIATNETGTALLAKKLHHVELTVSKSARQDPRIAVTYQEDELAGPNSTLTATAGWQDKPLGNASFTKDFLWFDQLGHRLTATFQGGSDYQPDLQIGNSLVNERRSGGSASATLELFRDSTFIGLPGQWLQASITGNANVVEDGPGNGPTERQTLATMDLGLNYFILKDGTRWSPRFQLQPHLTLGYSTSNDVTYARFSVTGNYHQLIPFTWLEWDSSANVSLASLGTPTIELPQFGGTSSVRGFRSDATQARLIWSLQNEVWIPLRLNVGLPPQIDALIRRNLYVAPFVDVGGVHESTGGLEGTQAGAGVGLRATYQSFTFRFDWAHSLTTVDKKFGGNTFYFTISYRPAF